MSLRKDEKVTDYIPVFVGYKLHLRKKRIFIGYTQVEERVCQDVTSEDCMTVKERICDEVFEEECTVQEEEVGLIL